MSLGLFGLLSLLGPDVRVERVQEIAATVEVSSISALVEPIEVLGLVEQTEVGAVVAPVTEVSGLVEVVP